MLKSRKILAIAISVALVAGLFVGSQTVSAEADKQLTLWYDAPVPNYYAAGAPATNENDWEWAYYSLPLGNGYFGVSTFGYTDLDRINLATMELYADGSFVDFAEMALNFGHDYSAVTNYRRYLSLDKAMAGVEYTYNNVTYTREMFTSYPDKMLVIRLTASEPGALSFDMGAIVPYTRGTALSGQTYADVPAEGNPNVALTGYASGYNIDFAGSFEIASVDDDATVTANDYGDGSETNGYPFIPELSATDAYQVYDDGFVGQKNVARGTASAYTNMANYGGLTVAGATGEISISK